MVKVKMLDKGLNTTKFGFLEAGSTIEVPGHFADWLIKTKRATKAAAKKPAKKK
jgi:hypothetical protein